MSKNTKKRITVGGNIPRPKQKAPTTIIVTQPQRFGIDIADYTQAIRSAENVDFNRRAKLYDLYADILMDTHLSCVIDKRYNAVLCDNIEFRRNGKPDKTVNEQMRSPWFRRLIRDITDAQVWGFSLLQFHKEGEWINYDLVPRKHVDPVRKLILRHQTDITGTDWEEYPHLLFVGGENDLGLLAKAAPWVIYKRNTTADWAQFSEVFGMPVREYIYETDDDEARQRCLDDAADTGSLAVLVHSKESELKLLESGNKTGSADLYERLCERCNSEISKLFLGNTLTTEASETGTQALGTVHNKVEDKVGQADRRNILDVLNYDATDILLAMGINTEGGEFYYPEQKDVDPNTKISILTQLKTNFDLPVDDDYLYEEFGVKKPENYDEIKAEGEKRRQMMASINTTPEEPEETEEEKPEGKKPESSEEEDEEPDKKKKKSFFNHVKSFFVKAPKAEGSGAALRW